MVPAPDAPAVATAWIDTHCHLDAAEFAPDVDEVVARARSAAVPMMVIPAVEAANFGAVRTLAHRYGLAYALGIHPMYTPRAVDEDLDRLEAALLAHRGDPRLVAVGEIGLDGFVPGLDMARQQRFYVEQLKIARRAGLPVLLHVRRSADLLLAGLRRIEVAGGIGHAFNGSDAQAAAFVARGFRLGFGGAATFERALQIRRLAASLPAHAIVMETDAPDIPPHWLYRSAAERAGAGGGADGQGARPQGRNEPAELPRIGAVVAALRGVVAGEWAATTSANAHAALPRLAALG